MLRAELRSRRPSQSMANGAGHLLPCLLAQKAETNSRARESKEKEGEGIMSEPRTPLPWKPSTIIHLALKEDVEFAVRACNSHDDLLAALEASLIARIEVAKRRSHEETRFCARCGMTCEILHKTRTFEFDDGKQVSWHNATDGDCWGQEEAAHAAIAKAKEKPSD